MAWFFLLVVKAAQTASVNYMRKVFLFIAAAGLMASCNNSSQSTAQQEQLDSMKNAMAKQQTIDSMNSVNATQPAGATNVAQPVSSGAYTRHESHIQRSEGGGTTTTTTETSSSNVNAGAAPRKRKGMSPVATGAIIGAGAGAITGALVDKNKGAGALIGGVLGAGAGAGTGAIIKKEDKKKDAQQ